MRLAERSATVADRKRAPGSHWQARICKRRVVFPGTVLPACFCLPLGVSDRREGFRSAFPENAVVDPVRVC